MNALSEEQQDNARLQKAKEYLAHCREVETQARKALQIAANDTFRAKEKYEILFTECERRAVARRKNGQIAINPGY